MPLATRNRFVREGWLGVLIGVLLGLIVPAVRWAPLPPLGIGTAHWGVDGWLFAVLGVGLGLVQTVLAMIAKRGPFVIMLGVLATVAPVVALVQGVELSDAARNAAYDCIARTGDRIAVAIEAFVNAHGRAPQSLAELPDATLRAQAVPGYWDGRRYEYARHPPGSTPAREQTWVITGDRDSTDFRVLSLIFNAAGELLSAKSTQKDAIGDTGRFDSTTWMREPDRRQSMLGDLARGVERGDIPLPSALATLGPPRFDFVLPHATWSLSARLFRGRTRHAVLCYAPDGGLAADFSRLRARTRHGQWWFLSDSP